MTSLASGLRLVPNGVRLAPLHGSAVSGLHHCAFDKWRNARSRCAAVRRAGSPRSLTFSKLEQRKPDTEDADKLWSLADLANMIEANQPKLDPRGSYKKRQVA